MRSPYYFSILIIVITSCTPKPSAILIDQVFETDAISSGSGISIKNDSLYIIGDDAEYITKFSLVDSQYRRISFFHNATFDRIPRSVKHDLESSCIGKAGNDEFLFAFGSGSISPYRDTLFAIKINDSDSSLKLPLTTLYQSIRKKAELSENELNIEGATIAGNKLILLNRGKNLFLSMNWNDFINYLLHEAPVPTVQIEKVQLPEINGFQVGLSGASTLDDNTILFTASLEETRDFTQDGTVKGSYIGTITITDGKIATGPLLPLNDNTSKPIPIKLESIDIITKEPQHIHAIAVADNDDGKTMVMKLTLEFN